MLANNKKRNPQQLKLKAARNFFSFQFPSQDFRWTKFISLLLCCAPSSLCVPYWANHQRKHAHNASKGLLLCFAALEKKLWGNYSEYHINWYFPYWYRNRRYEKSKERRRNLIPRRCRPVRKIQTLLNVNLSLKMLRNSQLGSSSKFSPQTSMNRSKPFFFSLILAKMLVIRKSLKSSFDVICALIFLFDCFSNFLPK